MLVWYITGQPGVCAMDKLLQAHSSRGAPTVPICGAHSDIPPESATSAEATHLLHQLLP